MTKTPCLRLCILALALLAGAFSDALAQTAWPTPGAGAANGVVQMCLNTQGQAVPCGPGAGGGSAVIASSGVVSIQPAVATLPGVANKTTFICGITASYNGASSGATVNATVTGLASGGTVTFIYSVPGGSSNGASGSFTFSPCLPASGVNTAIVFTLPALGAGNTAAVTNAWGFQL